MDVIYYLAKLLLKSLSHYILILSNSILPLEINTANIKIIVLLAILIILC